jgi:hypothetical protein
VRRAIARQIRWNKIRYAFSPWCYTAEFLVNPLPFALLAGASTLLVDAQHTRHAVVAIIAAALIRVLQAFLLDRVADAGLRWHQIMLAPVQDVIQWTAQFAPYRSKEVMWQGHRARLGPGTEMHPGGA